MPIISTDLFDFVWFIISPLSLSFSHLWGSWRFSTLYRVAGKRAAFLKQPVQQQQTKVLWWLCYANVCCRWTLQPRLSLLFTLHCFFFFSSFFPTLPTQKYNIASYRHLLARSSWLGDEPHRTINQFVMNVLSPCGHTVDGDDDDAPLTLIRTLIWKQEEQQQQQHRQDRHLSFTNWLFLFPSQQLCANWYRNRNTGHNGLWQEE